VRSAETDAQRITVEVQGNKVILKGHGTLLGGKRRKPSGGVVARESPLWKTESRSRTDITARISSTENRRAPMLRFRFELA